MNYLIDNKHGPNIQDLNEYRVFSIGGAEGRE